MIREYVYTIREAAEVLSVDRDTVRRWMLAGKLSGESIGGAVLGCVDIFSVARSERQ